VTGRGHALYEPSSHWTISRRRVRLHHYTPSAVSITQKPSQNATFTRRVPPSSRMIVLDRVPVNFDPVNQPTNERRVRSWLVALTIAASACGPQHHHGDSNASRPPQPRAAQSDAWSTSPDAGAAATAIPPVDAATLNAANDPADVTGAVAPAGPLACAKTWASASQRAGQRCEPGTTSRCAYKEGNCECDSPPGPPAPCQGIRSPPPSAAGPRRWMCTPTPPLFRPDGCPTNEPSQAAVCRGHATCRYGSCGFMEYTCTSGHWKLTGGSGPPP
jgi:hypothetical protein